MPKKYSLDLRKRVVNCVLEGNNFSQAAKKFNVSYETARLWYNKYLKGSLEDPVPKTRKPKKLDSEVLKKYVDENPDKTVKQIAEHFNVWYYAVYYRLNQMGYTYKKRLSLQGARPEQKRKIS